MKKRKSLFDRKLDDTYEIGQMLVQEGKTFAESRAYTNTTTVLIFIMDELRRIGFILCILLGLICSQIWGN